MSREVAEDFFKQLAIFSDRYVSYLGLTESVSVWGSESWTGDGPNGAIIHYTADSDMSRVARWFLRSKFQAKVSANLIISDHLHAHHDTCAAGLPLVQKLPVTILQPRLPDMPAWHATWTNRVTYGIEVVNAGEVRKGTDGTFMTWRRRDGKSAPWTQPWKPQVIKAPVDMYGAWWSPFLLEQIEAIVMALRYARDYYGTFQKPWILGHEQVQGVNTWNAGNHDKRDPGPTFPIHGVRAAVFDGWTPLEQYKWFQNFAGDHRDGVSWRDGVLIDWVHSDPEKAGPLDPRLCEKRFTVHLRAWADSTGDVPASVLPGKVALKLLGYHVSDGVEMDLDDLKSLRIFKRMAGLPSTGYFTKATRRGLLERLLDRKILK